MSDSLKELFSQLDQVTVTAKVEGAFRGPEAVFESLGVLLLGDSSLSRVFRVLTLDYAYENREIFQESGFGVNPGEFERWSYNGTQLPPDIVLGAAAAKFQVNILVWRFGIPQGGWYVHSFQNEYTERAIMMVEKGENR